MAARISLILVLLTLELLFPAAVGAAGDIQQYTDPQGTIHIDNRGSASKDKDKDKDKAVRPTGFSSRRGCATSTAPGNSQPPYQDQGGRG